MSTSTAVARETDSDLSLLERLRSGDQLALADLVERHHHSLLRLASVFLRNRASAEEVVQETWMAVLKATASFEGRSRIKTWIFRILIRRAQTRLIREARTIPFSALRRSRLEAESVVDSVCEEISPPCYEKTPEEQVIERETMRCLKLALEGLPVHLRAVVTLRDIEGLDSGEVCNLLGISDATQRVRLHRARSRLRAALKRHLAEGAAYPRAFAMAVA
jgi:RNA polymerase sigma-70 factor (ECF subfamily)